MKFRFAAAISLLLFSLPSFAIDTRPNALSLDSKARVLPRLQPNYDSARVAAYLSDPSWSGWNASHGGNWTAQFDTLSGKPRRVYGGAIPWISPSASDAELENVARNFIAANGALIAASNDRLVFVPEIASPTSDGRIRYAAFDYSINGVPVDGARLIFAVNNGNMIYWNSTNIANVPTVTTPSISANNALAALLTYTGVSATDIELLQQPTLKLLPRNTTTGGLLRYQLVYEVAFETSDHGVWAGHIDAATGAVLAFGNTNRYACPLNPVGRVSGGIRPAEATDAEVVRSFPLVRVDTRAGAAGSTVNGIFSFSGGETSTGLGGIYFAITCADCVKSQEDPVEEWQPFVSSTNGYLSLGTGGGDQIGPTKTTSYGNGISTPADRTAFFHTNVARLMAKKWLELPWLENSTVGVNVNINDVCNAFWNGVSTNFFKAGVSGSLTCNNTGEIRDVMQHEWGHGLDSNDGIAPGLAAGFGDFATGEAVGDHVALFVDHDSCIGQSFANPRNTGPFLTDPDNDTYPVRNCNGVRNIDELRANRGKITSSNVTQKCATATANAFLALAPYYVGPLLSEGHCEGEIWGQAAWHLQQNLVTGRRYGTATVGADRRRPTYMGDPLPAGADGSANPSLDRDRAWTIHERLFYASRPLVAAYAPSHMQAMGGSAYDGYMVVDDEGDGLANGTPHAAYINDAFMDHGIEEIGPPGIRPAVSDAANCAALPSPAVTTSPSLDAVTGMPSITVSWTAVAGANGYNVLRTERRNDVFLLVASVGSGTTSVVDAGVDNGVTYLYRVEAVRNGGCYAGSGGGLATATAALPAARFRSASVDDAFGNGDNALDPGERASLYVVIENFGLSSLTEAEASLRSVTPGVTVTQAGPRIYGTVAAGSTAGPTRTFGVAVDRNAAMCGAVADFVLTITTAQGCITTAFSIPIGNDGTSCLVFKDANAQPKSIAVTSDTVGACGDGDRFPDPGETIDVTVEVDNTGTRQARDVVVSLAVDKPYFTFVGPSSINVGTVEGGGTQVKTAVFRLAVGAAPFNDVARFTATVGNNSLVQSTYVNRDKVNASVTYDFNVDSQGWTATGAAVGWIRTLAPQTGNTTNVFYSQYEASSCPLLVSPVVEFSANSSLSFDLAYVSENTDQPWDGIDVQVSVLGGRWFKLYPVEGYSSPTHAGSGCIPGDTPMFSGYSPVMLRYTAPIPPEYAGREGQVRFRWSADPLVGAPIVGGAWVDNVTLGNVTVAVPDPSCP